MACNCTATIPKYTFTIDVKESVNDIIKYTFTDRELQSVFDGKTCLAKPTVGFNYITVDRRAYNKQGITCTYFYVSVVNLIQKHYTNFYVDPESFPIDLRYEFNLPEAKKLRLFGD